MEYEHSQFSEHHTLHEDPTEMGHVFFGKENSTHLQTKKTRVINVCHISLAQTKKQRNKETQTGHTLEVHGKYIGYNIVASYVIAYVTWCVTMNLR